MYCSIDTREENSKRYYIVFRNDDTAVLDFKSTFPADGDEQLKKQKNQYKVNKIQNIIPTW